MNLVMIIGGGLLISVLGAGLLIDLIPKSWFADEEDGE